VRRRIAFVVLVSLVGVPAVAAAILPGLKTPSRNISCFYVPIKPTTHGSLLCDIGTASYLRSVQDTCQERAGLDWHGFSLRWSRGKAQLVCAGGIMYDVGHDTPRFTVLAYGHLWRSHGFTCASRTSGLTCTNGRGNGLFLSRASYRLW
jgi:uncharacterized protein DUF6636